MQGTMLAQRLYTDTKKITVEEVPIPTPGPGEVLIKVVYCGICHSDLSLIDGNFPPQLPVVTQGHECSGDIAETKEGNPIRVVIDPWAENESEIQANREKYTAENHSE